MKSFAVLLAATVLGLSGGAPTSADEAAYAEERRTMVETIDRHSMLTSGALAADGIAPEVRAAMLEVPRHLFVPEGARSVAYADRPVPIGFGQTISQPFIVALMTDMLDVEPDDVVLEIGTGSGYQAAVLSPLVARVCTVEIIPGLGRPVAERLARLGYDNVQARVGDGYNGWPECGPFDAIVVTAAADHVPPPLVAQLKPGGRMAIPVGGAFGIQHLTLVEKSPAGEVRARQLLPVRFVPLTRGG